MLTETDCCRICFTNTNSQVVLSSIHAECTPESTLEPALESTPESIQVWNLVWIQAWIQACMDSPVREFCCRFWPGLYRFYMNSDLDRFQCSRPEERLRF